jgi:hypothetical protein
MSKVGKLFKYFITFIFVQGGVYCGIYKGSYNVSNESYSDALLYSPSSDSCNSFNRYQFCMYHLHTCVHIFCTLFTLLFLFPTSPAHWYLLPPSRTCFALLFSDFVEEKRENIKRKEKCDFFAFFEIKIAYTGSFLVIFPCMYVFKTSIGLSPLFFFTRP